jgi:hypothetical protein
VADLWLHVPSTWAHHLDILSCHTSTDLINLAADRDEQLQASSINNLTRLVRAELQRQGQLPSNARQQYGTQAANVEEEDDDLLTMVADTRKPAYIENIQVPGKFPLPLASNRLKKILPQPCHNCGSPLHYNRNCVSWIKQGRPGGKNTSSNKINEAYTSLYIAML